MKLGEIPFQHRYVWWELTLWKRAWTGCSPGLLDPAMLCTEATNTRTTLKQPAATWPRTRDEAKIGCPGVSEILLKEWSKDMRSRSILITGTACVAFFLGVLAGAAQSTPRRSLLALSKTNHTLAIVDPTTLQVIARAPVGPDPHEVIASSGWENGLCIHLRWGTIPCAFCH